MCLKKYFRNIAGVMSILLLAGLVYAVHDIGLFELEGNAIDSPFGPPDDWQNVANGTSSATKVTDGDTGGIIQDPTSQFVDMIFTGGGSKDDLDVSNWQHTVGSVPDKDNLTDAAAAAYQAPNGDLIIYFMADRFAVNGAAQVGFWFFQDEVGPQPDGSFSGDHMDGDILVLAEFTIGGSVSDIDVWVWDENNGTADPEEGGSANTNLRFVGQFSACGDTPNDDVCAISNSTVIDTFWPYQAKKGGPGGGGGTNKVGVNGFFEGGINITALFPEVTGCFTSFLAETRSSHSVDAVLKDFVHGSFNLCSVSADKSCLATINAAGNGADVTFAGSALNDGSLTLTTQVSDSVSGSTFDDVCIDDNGDGICQAGETSDPPDLTGLGTGTISFTHGVGVKVAFSGSYFTTTLSDTTPVPGFDFSDTITVESLLNSVVVASDSATADCSAIGEADILVTKSCTNARIVGGNTFVADISGTVTNTGNVRMDNVTFNDVTDAGAPAGSYDVRRSDNSVFSPGGSLAPGEVLTFTAAVSSTTQTDHADTITWSGENTFDSNDVATDSASAPGAQEVCSVNPIPSIVITKDCAAEGVDLGFLNNILTVFVNTDVVVTNDGTDENLTGVSVSDPEGGLSWTSGHPFTCNSAGTLCTANADMAPGAAASFTQRYNPDTAGTDILGNLDEPDLVSFFNEASTSGAGVLSGIPVGDQDDTECPLCQ